MTAEGRDESALHDALPIVCSPGAKAGCLVGKPPLDVLAIERRPVRFGRSEERSFPAMREPSEVFERAGGHLTIDLANVSPNLGPVLRRIRQARCLLAAHTTPPEVDVEIGVLDVERGHHPACFRSGCERVHSWTAGQ